MTSSPLLVTGLPRSGTSWTGKMLEAGHEVVYVNEPLNPKRPPGRSPGVLNASVSHRFQYIAAPDDEVWRRAFADTIRLRYHPIAELRAVRRAYDVGRMAKYGTQFTWGRLRNRRALLDDPYALFSSRWLCEVMGVRTMVLVRDPVGLLGSWKNLGWKIDLRELLDQPALVAAHLEPWVDDMHHAVESGDWAQQMCCLWNVAHDVVDGFRDVPNLTIRRYEDLAFEPLAGFEGLYDWFGLEWSDHARQSISDATTASGDEGRGFSWSLRGGLSRTAFQRMDSRAAVATAAARLSAGEVDEVRERTSSMLDRFPASTR